MAIIIFIIVMSHYQLELATIRALLNTPNKIPKRSYSTFSATITLL